MPDSSCSPIHALLCSGVPLTYPTAVVAYGSSLCPPHVLCAGPASEETVFDLASLTKALVTSVLCMRALADGRIALADEVLPGISVATLLRHQSGLLPWIALWIDTPTTQRDLVQAPSADVRRLLVQAAARTPRTPAGQHAVYSDLGFLLLGDYLEQRLGQRLDDAFSPLAARLDAALFFLPLDRPAPSQQILSRCVPTHRESPLRERLHGVVHDDNARAMLGVAGHAGLFGTATGVFRLAAALADTALDRQTPLRRALALPPALVQTFWALPGRDAAPGSTWGLGWDHPAPIVDGKTASSAGALWPRDSVGHLGFTGCSVWVHPSTARIAVFLSNRVCMPTPQAATQAQASIKDLRPRLHDAIWQALDAAA